VLHAARGAIHRIWTGNSADHRGVQLEKEGRPRDVTRRRRVQRRPSRRVRWSPPRRVRRPSSPPPWCRRQRWSRRSLRQCRRREARGCAGRRHLCRHPGRGSHRLAHRSLRLRNRHRSTADGNLRLAMKETAGGCGQRRRGAEVGRITLTVPQLRGRRHCHAQAFLVSPLHGSGLCHRDQLT
jgi:hypothetical protein